MSLRKANEAAKTGIMESLNVPMGFIVDVKDKKGVLIFILEVTHLDIIDGVALNLDLSNEG